MKHRASGNGNQNTEKADARCAAAWIGDKASNELSMLVQMDRQMPHGLHIQSPLRLFVAAAVMIVLLDAVLSVAVSVLFKHDSLKEYIAEPLLLSVGVLVVLYVLLLRPVRVLSDDVTRSSESLAETQRILETTLANTPGIAYRSRMPGGWPVNVVGGNLDGMIGPEAAGQIRAGKVSLWEYVHSEDRSSVQEVVRNAVTARQPYYLEFRLQTADGDTRWVAGHGYPVVGIGGYVIALEGVLADISARKLAEEEVQELNALYHSLLQTIPLGIDIVDAAGNIQYINRSLCERYGDEVIGQPCWRVLKDDRRQCAECPLRAGIHLGETAMTRIEGMLGGSTCLVAHTGMLYHGKPALLEVIQDISSQKAIEESLARSRDHYLQLFEEFPALIWRSGTDAKCNYVNRTWLTFTGRDLQDELGDGWADGVHPEDLARCMNTYLAAFAAHTSFEMEYRLRRADGEYRWMADYGRPFYGIDGEFAGYIGSCHDITERKEHAEQLDYLATHDALTGMPNRRVLEDTLDRVIARAKRGASSMLMFVDLDHFKEINDTLGHHTGDSVLVTVAHLIQQTLRDGDLLVRLGGDEFAVLLEGIDMEEGSAVAERVRASVSDNDFALSECQHHLSLSIGLCTIDGSESAERVLSLADTAMYEAKSGGRNRVVGFRKGTPSFPSDRTRCCT